ncbi:MAG: type I restriction endonuclease, partial [Thermoplasmatales archaeon]|nr:type I restriction endonuclease [Thermoplasmatales archaeon]
MTSGMAESDLEELFMKTLEEQGYERLYGPDISPDGPQKEREYSDAIISGRLKESLRMVNPSIPEEAIEEAFRRIIKPESQDLIANNHDFHNLLVNGVDVQYRRNDGTIKHDRVFIFDF